MGEYQHDMLHSHIIYFWIYQNIGRKNGLHKTSYFLVSCQFEMDTYLIGDKSVMQWCTIIYHVFEGHLKKYATHRRSTQLER